MKTSDSTIRSYPDWLGPATWAAALLTTGVILYWGLSRAPQNAFDDAYITYRYADNFRQGLGLRYNPGEWVFGTTTPFFTLLLGLLGLVFSDLELLGHWLGVLGWLAAALLTIPLFRQENRLYAALIAPLFVAFQPVMYTSLGMETPLLAALMLAVAVLWLRGWNKIAVLLAALLILTRHDSALWLLLIGLEVGRRRLKSGKPLVEALPWREGLAAAGLTAVWFLFAWFRYGSPLPNSAAAKIGQTNLMPVQGQPPFVLALMEAFIDGMPGFMFVVLPAFLLFSFYLIGRRVRRFWWLLVWPVLYILLYTLLNVANFPWYFVPPLTVLSLALALTFGSLLGDDEWQVQASTSILLSRPIRRGTAVLALLLILYTQAFLTLNNQDKAGYRASYLAAANWLRESTSPEAMVATIEIGVIGYHSQRPILDTQGLISRDMTSHQLGWDDTLVYALNAHQPDYALALPGTAWDIVIAQWWFQEAFQPVEQFAEATLFGRKPTNPQALVIDAANRYEGGLVLDELTLPTAELEPGQNLTASLAISVTQPAPPLRFTTYLIDSRLTNRYEVTDTDPFANLYPSQNWQPGDYLRLPLRLAVPDDLPWGAYQFGIVLFDTAAGTPLKQSNQSTEIHLGYLRNGRPDSTLNPDLTPMQINQEWANGIRLQEIALPERAAPGNSIPVQLLWNTSALPEKDWTYFIHLVNDQEEIVAQLDQRPLNGRWPTPAWRPEEPFWESVMLSIPPDLPAGSYHLRLGFYILDERLPLMASGADFLWLPAVIEIGA